MDQGRIAGIGNLLADEILWRAGLDPARPAGQPRRRRAAPAAAHHAGRAGRAAGRGRQPPRPAPGGPRSGAGVLPAGRDAAGAADHRRADDVLLPAAPTLSSSTRRCRGTCRRVRESPFHMTAAGGPALSSCSLRRRLAVVLAWLRWADGAGERGADRDDGGRRPAPPRPPRPRRRLRPRWPRRRPRGAVGRRRCLDPHGQPDRGRARGVRRDAARAGRLVLAGDQARAEAPRRARRDGHPAGGAREDRPSARPCWRRCTSGAASCATTS